MNRICLWPALLCFLLLNAGCGGSPRSLAARGIQSLNQGNAARAESLLKKALRNPSDDPEGATVWNALGLACQRNGRAKEAEAAFIRAAKLAPDRFDAPYNLGLLLLQLGRLPEAETALKTADAASPDRSEALEILATLALRNGDSDTALGLLERARARNEHPRVLNALALTRRQTGAQFNIVGDLLKKAVALDPNHAPSQLNLAALLDSHRVDPEQAAAHYEAYLRLEPESAQSFAVRQRLQVLAERLQTGGVGADPVRGEVTSLLEQATEAARGGDTNRALHLCLRAATSAGRAQRLDLEERALRGAAALAPESPRAHVGLGRFLIQQNQAAAALASFQKAVVLAPTWPPALQGLAEAAVAARQTSVARDALQAAENAARENPVLLYEIAVIHQDILKDRARAQRMLSDGLRRFPDHEKAAEARERLR